VVSSTAPVTASPLARLKFAHACFRLGTEVRTGGFSGGNREAAGGELVMKLPDCIGRNTEGFSRSYRSRYEWHRLYPELSPHRRRSGTLGRLTCAKVPHRKCGCGAGFPFNDEQADGREFGVQCPDCLQLGRFWILLL